ncbi:hypothetical protein M0805_007386 [Coniferiporia weirii]|nr:hypothetical protein M0805_007386 [Coniferiporia weirii]
MATHSGSPDFACRCLNIRLFQRSDKTSLQAQPASAGDYQPLYVGNDGLIIMHNELTLRSRSSVCTSGSRLTQHTTVICLVCNTASYRVNVDVPPDSDAKEGPVLPTEDWTERDTLTSMSGWVEVHTGGKGCIGEEEASQAMSSPSYSRYFSIVLQDDSHIPSTSPSSTLPETQYSTPISLAFLSCLPSFLPPPPFTPSHPIFLHLSGLAVASSNAARGAAESRIDEFVKQQLGQLEEEETRLKAQLEHLWRNVQESLRKVERRKDDELILSLRSRRSSSPGARPSSVLQGIGSPVVRDFITSSYHAPRMSSASVARQSALSTSLATSSFHHPRAQQETNGQVHDAGTHRQGNLTPSPPPYVTNSSAGSSSTLSSSSAAKVSRSLKRNMDAVNDTAVSFRYSVIEEQEKARRLVRSKAVEDQRKKNTNGQTQAETQVADGGTNRAASQTAPAEPFLQDKRKEADSVDLGQVSSENRSGKKGSQRKVTFDVEPDIVTSKRDIITEKSEYYAPESEEDLIFELESSDITGAAEEKTLTGNVSKERLRQLDLSLYEASDRPREKNRRSIDIKNAGLPQSFIALRPSSLPVPSNIRPPISSRSDIQKHQATPSPVSSGRGSTPRKLESGEGPVRFVGSSNDIFHPHQRELLKFVAADTPSHRGAWNKGSNAWRIFDRGFSRGTDSSTILEEEEGVESPRGPSNSGSTSVNSKDPSWMHYHLPNLAGSLPVSIAPISQLKGGGSSSLQPKTSLIGRQDATARPLSTVAEDDKGRQKSAAANRREAYAERDRARSMDPGILDFVHDEEDEEESSSLEFNEDELGQTSTSKSRQHALKIIKARNAVPAEGLWRSLAT